MKVFKLAYGLSHAFLISSLLGITNWVGNYPMGMSAQVILLLLTKLFFYASFYCLSFVLKHFNESKWAILCIKLYAISAFVLYVAKLRQLQPALYAGLILAVPLIFSLAKMFKVNNTEIASFFKAIAISFLLTFIMQAATSQLYAYTNLRIALSLVPFSILFTGVIIMLLFKKMVALTGKN